jgi:serine/threonine protein kinase
VDIRDARTRPRPTVASATCGTEAEKHPAATCHANGSRLALLSSMHPGLDRLALTGTTIDNMYNVGAAVARGGFGIVYSGWHRDLEVPIAIKVLTLPPRTAYSVGVAVVARFWQESRIHYRLSREHLAIVRTLACGVTVAPSTRERVPYLVMEWLDGRTLASAIAGAGPSRVTVGPCLADAINLLDGAAHGLAAAHDAGIVHRDVKPRNIFVVRDEDGTYRTRLLDFGIAKVLEHTTLGISPASETNVGENVLSPPYAAPEQFDPAYGPIGPQTDVYSLAITLMELLRLERVMTCASVAEYAARHCAVERPVPSALGLDLPPGVEGVLARAVELHARDRWADVGVFWGTLKNALRSLAEELPSGPRLRSFQCTSNDDDTTESMGWSSDTFLTAHSARSVTLGSGVPAASYSAR